MSDPPLDVGQLTTLFPGGLSATDASEVTAHLEACAHCRAVLRALVPPEPAEIQRLMESLPLPGAVEKRRWWWWTFPLAAAAAATAWLLLRPVAPPLPAFEAGPLEGGVMLSKSAEPSLEVPVFVSESRIEWIIRPPTALTEPPAARAYVLRDGRLRALPDAVVSPLAGGGVALRGRAGDLLGEESGEITLLMGLARDLDQLPAGTQGVFADTENAPDIRWYRARLIHRPTP